MALPTPLNTDNTTVVNTAEGLRVRIANSFFKENLFDSCYY